MRRICTAVVGAAIVVLPTVAKAIHVNFEGFPEGQPVEFAGFGTGIFAVSAIGNSGGTSAAVLNTESSSNPNLKYPYAGGNLKTSRLRKVLIVPTEPGGSTPDPAGGQLTLTFFGPVRSFGFDVLDIDVADAPNTFVTFSVGGANIATIPFSEFKNVRSPFRRNTMSFGNNTANRVAPLNAVQFGTFAFDEVVFDFPSEFALDNVYFQTMVIPEPTALGALCSVMLLGLRRRRTPRSLP